MENVEITRNKIHDYCVQLMYSFLILQKSESPIYFQDAVSNVVGLPYEECDVYLKEVLIKCLKNEDKIIDYISKFLNNWTFDRLNETIQAILIVAVCEYYLQSEPIDKAIIINTSVKLSKRYGDGGQKDYKFVNAVLQNCLDDGRKNLLLD